LKAKDIFQDTNGILQVEYTDPFSFIYALAQRNTRKQQQEIFSRAKAAFNLGEELPTDWIFPTPTPHAKSLFYTKGEYISNEGTTVGMDVIWDLFDEVFHNKTVTNDYFQKVLSIKNVGVTKLTQTMFLVNPEKYIPFDTQMNALPLPSLQDLKKHVPEIEKAGFPVYKEIVDQLTAAFPGCAMYEVNLFNVLLFEPGEDQLRLTNRYCQVSSWADGQTEPECFDKYVEENAVWTGGATSGSGQTAYPLTQFKKGDIVLVRRGTKNLGGIGVIIDNQYIPGGWDEELMIKIIWLNKANGWTEDALAQWTGFDLASDKTIAAFEKQYANTFKLIEFLRNKQKVMVNHSLNKYKNIILQGPPGTGKTRFAKQIGLWLTNGEAKDMTLMEAIDRKLIQNDANIEGVAEIKLIQFHPAYYYEDLVRGIITTTVGDKVHYTVKNKILAEIAALANEPQNQLKAYVLIIDEMNRANLPSVLGELIYALEYRGQAVETMYSIKDEDGTENAQLVIPPNLYIIGTMNTADRSVGHIDYAIRRRFSFVQVSPDDSVITGGKAKVLYQKVVNIFKEYTTQEFNTADVAIGHSYFLCDDDEIALKLKYDIRPLLLEYVADGILKESAKPEIERLNA
jgi:MoxR-like ATPase